MPPPAVVDPGQPPYIPARHDDGVDVMADADVAAQVPVTVLTGYLGAGKTTLLNRILTEQHGRKYAVVINEFGELGVDNDLVVDTDEEVFEMNNGCICCTVRGDLIRIVGGLMKRRDKFDGIIIETTGLANPAPVAQTFFVDEGVRAKTRLDAIVTVVDAKHLPARLEDSHEAADQIAFADVIVLNKTDLVSPEELAAVEGKIRAINRFATIHRTERAALPIDQVLGRGAVRSEPRAGECCRGFLDGEDDHEQHRDEVTSVSFEVEKPIDPEEVHHAWIGLLSADGQGAGFAAPGRRASCHLPATIDGLRFQAVHMIADGDFIGPWKDGEKRVSRLVFIGRNLSRPLLRRGFESCQVD